MKINFYIIYSLLVIITICASNFSNATTIEEYLAKPTIPEGVASLAKEGHQRLKNINSIDRKRSDWLNKTFGIGEKEILTTLSRLAPPPTWTINEINQSYRQARSKEQTNQKENHSKPDIYIVHNVNMGELHKYPLGEDAIVQLASQFNWLESPSNQIVPVSSYPYDPTQGPTVAIETAAATLYRHAMVSNGKLQNALDNLLPKNFSFYKNGYLELASMNNTQCPHVLEQITENIGSLRILPQWVINESSGIYQLHVLSSAPSFQGRVIPKKDSCANAISRKLVIEQYTAIAKIAVIRSHVADKPVALHLTLVGQGVFNNHPSVAEEAIIEAIKVTQSMPVSIYLHIFQDSIKTDYLINILRRQFTISEVTAERFKKYHIENK